MNWKIVVMFDMQAKNENTVRRKLYDIFLMRIRKKYNIKNLRYEVELE